MPTELQLDKDFFGDEIQHYGSEAFAVRQPKNDVSPALRGVEIGEKFLFEGGQYILADKGWSPFGDLWLRRFYFVRDRGSRTKGPRSKTAYIDGGYIKERGGKYEYSGGPLARVVYWKVDDISEVLEGLRHGQEVIFNDICDVVFMYQGSNKCQEKFENETIGAVEYLFEEK